MLPKFIPDKLALHEVAYQTFLHEVRTSLSHDKKALWPMGLWDQRYLRSIFGATKEPHLLPKFIPEKLSLEEVVNHTFMHMVGALHTYDKKVIQPPFPFHIVSKLSKKQL
jgi:hypothetical protein